MEKGIRRNAVIEELTRSPHGALTAYVQTGGRAAREDPEFLSHLIAWNEKKGHIRDSKVALPVVYLSAAESRDVAFRENALAHLALLDPRNLLRAVKFSREIGVEGNGMRLRKLVADYLRVREARWPWWERAALQHRDSMKSLYAVAHVKPAAMADLILFKRKPPKGTLFELLKQLPTMSATEAAGHILKRRLPFLILQGVLGARVKEPALLMALIDQMTPAEVVTNAGALEKLGVKDHPETRAALKEALKRASEAKAGALKTTRAAEKVKDEDTRKALRLVQEKQLDNMGIEGDWLVLGDKSGSMRLAIEGARALAGVLARLAKGKVHLIFFDAAPRYFDVTGKSYEEIQTLTRAIDAGGATSVGCGLAYAVERGLEFDGIAIVTDAGENTAPPFAAVYDKVVKRQDREIPVYLYLVGNTLDGGGLPYFHARMESLGHPYELFDLTAGVDYYSLPNVAQTMRINRWSLADEILETPLLTLEQALKGREVAA